MSDRLITDQQAIRWHYDSGLILNAECLCPDCKLRPKHPRAEVCEVCQPTRQRERQAIRQLVSRPAESGSFHVRG